MIVQSQIGAPTGNRNLQAEAKKARSRLNNGRSITGKTLQRGHFSVRSLPECSDCAGHAHSFNHFRVAHRDIDLMKILYINTIGLIEGLTHGNLVNPGEGKKNEAS